METNQNSGGITSEEIAAVEAKFEDGQGQGDTIIALRQRFGKVTEDPRLKYEPSGQRRKPQNPPPPPGNKKPVQQAEPVTSTQQKEERTPSLKDQLLQRAKGLGSAEQIRHTLREAEEAGATPEIVKLFGEMVRRGDEIGIRRYGFSRSPEEARQEWLGLSWNQWEENLHSWAIGGDLGAKEVVENLNLFAQNPVLRDFFREVATQFVRPVGQISTYGALVPWLESLVEKKLALRIINPRQTPEQGVTIQKGRETYLYLPLKGVRLSTLGWSFVKEAEGRAKAHAAEQELKAKALMAEITQGLTPLKISAGEGGNFFLSLGWNKGVLIEAKKQNGGPMMARVVKAVGLWIPSGLPSPWVLWSPDTDYVPLRGDQWPLEGIPQSLKTWGGKLLQAEEARSRADEERKKEQEEFRGLLDPIMKIATLPWEWKEQALSRLIKGEVTGIVPVWHQSFEWGRKKGLFGLAIQRQEGEEFLRIVDFISKMFPFPASLRGGQLPRLEVKVLEGRITARFDQLPQMEPQIFEAFKMSEKLIQLRLNAEHRASLGEPAPKGENNHTG